MSRLSSLSQAAIKAMFASETSEALIMLITIEDPAHPTEPLRLADSFTGTLASLTTDSEIIYGVTSNSKEYIFIPMQIGIPGEQETGMPQCSLTINYVTPEAINLVRNTLKSPVSVTIDLVLSGSPNHIEATFSGFKITSVSYNVDQITLDLNMVSLNREPFPCYTFTPANFPGLF